MSDMFGQRFDSAQLHLVTLQEIDFKSLVLFLLCRVAEKVAIFFT
jgi:hypothetical protein